MRLLISILLLTFSLAIYADVDSSGAKVKWSYIGNDGPERWGELNPDFALCATGKTQSPINIDKTVNKAGALKINYTPAPLKIIEDGTTQLTIGKEQTIYNDGHTIQVNFGPETKETLTFNNVTYRLVQFHIHTPSETQIKAESSAMEIHFVHQAPAGKVAVLAVMFTAGEANLMLEKIIKNAPTDENVEHTIEGQLIDPSQLLPKQQDFYQFMGSLTTPPCTEGLQWLVLAQKNSASPTQVLQIRTIIGGENARPVQPKKSRPIYYSSN